MTAPTNEPAASAAELRRCVHWFESTDTRVRCMLHDGHRGEHIVHVTWFGTATVAGDHTNRNPYADATVVIRWTR